MKLTLKVPRISRGRPNWILWLGIGVIVLTMIIGIGIAIYFSFFKKDVPLKCQSDTDCAPEGLDFVCIKGVCQLPRGADNFCASDKECKGDLLCLPNNLCGPHTGDAATTSDQLPINSSGRATDSMQRGSGHLSKEACVKEQNMPCIVDNGLWYKECPEGYRGMGQKCWKK